jgi:hypothetical protein
MLVIFRLRLIFRSGGIYKAFELRQAFGFVELTLDFDEFTRNIVEHLLQVLDPLGCPIVPVSDFLPSGLKRLPSDGIHAPQHLRPF